MDSDGPSTVALTIAATDWRAALVDIESLCTRVIRTTLARAADPGPLGNAEVSLLLTDDATIQGLNATYRNRDRPTNVLAFPALAFAGGRPILPATGPSLLGDIVLSLDTLRLEAADQGKPLADHFSHLLVHGMLHLLGHDHGDDAGARLMEELEIAVLADLGIPNPYADDPSAAQSSAALVEAEP